ncbi:hypothetical protein LshimejAT787_0905000 [Lyophyllum shimeji]|uniref:C3H1-type domain-containing protein n=1 Tax=Lyophyllum shimeji TaxID=47721 RepID=A0A9P3PSL8_LYOSH|nr:hypothetical protein LshimejAT787_0905000 [Lyophyllum shimeji]
MALSVLNSKNQACSRGGDVAARRYLATYAATAGASVLSIRTSLVCFDMGRYVPRNYIASGCFLESTESIGRLDKPSQRIVPDDSLSYRGAHIDDPSGLPGESRTSKTRLLSGFAWRGERSAMLWIRNAPLGINSKGLDLSTSGSTLSRRATCNMHWQLRTTPAAMKPPKPFTIFPSLIRVPMTLLWCHLLWRHIGPIDDWDWKRDEKGSAVLVSIRLVNRSWSSRAASVLARLVLMGVNLFISVIAATKLTMAFSDEYAMRTACRDHSRTYTKELRGPLRGHFYSDCEARFGHRCMFSHTIFNTKRVLKLGGKSQNFVINLNYGYGLKGYGVLDACDSGWEVTVNREELWFCSSTGKRRDLPKALLVAEHCLGMTAKGDRDIKYQKVQSICTAHYDRSSCRRPDCRYDHDLVDAKRIEHLGRWPPQDMPNYDALSVECRVTDGRPMWKIILKPAAFATLSPTSPTARTIPPRPFSYEDEDLLKVVRHMEGIVGVTET